MITSLNTATRTVNNIADLRLTPGGDGSVATKMAVLGYYMPGDGGDNEFTWNPTSTDPDDGGLTIGAWATGRWKAKESRVIRVKAFGVVGDGVTDDTDALNAALAASTYKIIDWQNIVSRIDGTVLISTPIKATSGMAKLNKYGSGVAILCKTIAGNGILGGDVNPAFTKGLYPRFVFPAVTRMDNTTPGLLDGSVGIQMEDCMNWTAEVPQVVNFEVSLKLTSAIANSYNVIYIGKLAGNVNIMLAPTTSAGYVNSNQFYGGSLTTAVGFNQLNLPDASSTHIKIVATDGLYQCNDNTFYSQSLEGFHQNGIDFNNYAFFNRVAFARIEMPYVQKYLKFAATAQQNKVIECYGMNDDLTGLMDDQGFYNLISGTTQKFGLYEYYDKEWIFKNVNKTLVSTGLPYLNRQILTETQERVISIPATGASFPYNLDMKYGNKFRIAALSDIPAGGLVLVNTPDNTHDYTIEILLVQGSTGVNIDPQFLTTAANDVLRYTRWPAPYKRNSGKDRYTIRKSFQTILTGLVIQTHGSDNYSPNSLNGVLANAVTTVTTAAVTSASLTSTFLNATYALDAYPIGSVVVYAALTDAVVNCAECRRVTATIWTITLTTKV